MNPDTQIKHNIYQAPDLQEDLLYSEQVPYSGQFTYLQWHLYLLLSIYSEELILNLF